MSKVVYISPIATSSGYGECSRDFSNFLITKYGNDVSFLSTRWGSCDLSGLEKNTSQTQTIKSRIIHKLDFKPEICYQTTTPHELKTIGDVNIAVTAGYEFTKWNQTAIDSCNNMDQLIVHSNFTKKCFYDSHNSNQQKTNIDVVHQCATSVFYENAFKKDFKIDDSMNSISETFCFLCVGMYTPQVDRKNIKQTILSFYHTFNKKEHKDVALILKINGPKYNTADLNDIQSMIKDLGSGFKYKCNVYFIYGNLSDVELRTLYSNNKIKCMISLTHGEGFGRPLFEASLLSIPTIVSNWSGHLDFISHTDDLLVTGKVDVAGDHVPHTTPNSSWFYPNTESAINCMKNLYENINDFTEPTIKLCESNLKKFNKTTMFEKYTDILKDYIN